MKDDLSIDLPLQTSRVSGGAVSDDHDLIAAGTRSGELVVWRLDGDDVKESRLALNGPAISSLAFSPDGEQLASGDCGAQMGELPLCQEGRIRIWNLKGQQGAPLTMTGHSSEVTSVLFLGKERLASGGFDGLLLIWDLGNPSAPLLRAKVVDEI